MQCFVFQELDFFFFFFFFKLVFSLFSKKKYFLLAREINLFNRNYFFL